MKIYGIGTDIANTNRIKKSLKNENFVKRLFDKNEINTYSTLNSRLLKSISLLGDLKFEEPHPI